MPPRCGSRVEEIRPQQLRVWRGTQAEGLKGALGRSRSGKRGACPCRPSSESQGEDPAFPFPGSQVPTWALGLWLCPSTSRLRLCFLFASSIWEWAQSQEQIQEGHAALGKTKKSHMGKRGILGRRRDHRESDSRQRGREEGLGRRPGPRAREDPLPVPTLSPTTPMSAKYCFFPLKPRVESFIQLITLGRGRGSPLCLPLAHEGSRAKVRGAA